MGITTDNVSAEKKKEWLYGGPAAMLNDILKGSEKYGIEVKVRDHSTARAVSTLYSLLKALGLRGSDKGLAPMYVQLCPRIVEERPELFGKKKVMLPDLALENVYGWLEKLSSTNPELASKLRRTLNEGNHLEQTQNT